MNLVIDIGNTLAKMAVFSEDGKVIAQSCYETISAKEVKNKLQTHTIKNAIVSSVREDDDEIVAIKQLLNSNTHFVDFSSETPLPIEIHYLDKATLGLDRIAAAMATWKMFPNQHSLSIVAGTCLVTNFVHQEGAFIGGSIAPGLEMRLKAMHHFTGKLPLAQKTLSAPVIGKTTNLSLNSGAVHGITFEIEGIINYYKSTYNNIAIVLSGGDACFLENSIKSSIFAAAELVQFGLNEILNTNV